MEIQPNTYERNQVFPLIPSKDSKEGVFAETKKETENASSIEKEEQKNNATEEKKALDFGENADKNERTVKLLDRVLRFELKNTINDSGDPEKKLIVSVLNEETGEVIRKIPPEELRSEVKALYQLIGIMLDKKG